MGFPVKHQWEDSGFPILEEKKFKPISVWGRA